MKKSSLAVIVVAVVAWLVLVGWMHDFVTLSGARTVYSAECIDGTWRGRTCTGRLAAGDRYRFKALKGHGEVLYWTAGSQRTSRKLSGCAIENARQWSCNKAPDQPAPVTHAMKNGHAVAVAGKPAPRCHSVEKWKWVLLEQGVRWFHDADT